MKYIDTSIKKYLVDVASLLPAPGGGSVAALTAGLGVSLLMMSAHFSKKNIAAAKARPMEKEIKKLAALQSKLESLIDKDVAVYKKLNAAMRMPKGVAGRDKALQEALINAASVPMEICFYCASAVKPAIFLARHGNKNLITDSACGMALVGAGFDAAVYNVRVNLKYIRQRQFVRACLRRIGKLKRDISLGHTLVNRKTEEVLKI